LESRTLFAFGVTAGTAPTGQPTLVVDNGGDLRFSVINGGSVTSTLHLGDVSSIKYKNQEMLATYAVTSRYSHYEQGLGSSTTITYAVDSTNGWIVVKCDDSVASTGSAIQYYVVRRNDNNIYLASLPTDVHGGPGEGRFIAYLDEDVFTNREAPSDNNGNDGAIEGSDVFGHPDGTTTSKFYNMGRRMIENVYHGVTGTAGSTPVGAWMFMGNREHSAGGPFFKDIDFQTGSAVEIYNCIFTGHTQTEDYRQGLHTYAFQFTDGSAPIQPDYAWMESLNLDSWIPASQRGTLTGVAGGVPAGHEVTVALSNPDAQYWATPDAAGNYTIAGVQAGTYTETLYDGELEVGVKTVTINAGATASSNIVDSFYIPSNPIFRIGTWDGSPVGFLNSDKIEIMHPSDVRMSSWTSTPNFVVGTNTDAQWPMVQFMGVNNSQRITFSLTSAQVQNLTLRIGVTLGFEGGRNKVTVNSGQSYAWTSTNPSATRDLNSRGITRGTWRGANQLYTYSIPSSALRAGTNTIDLPVISGSYVAGQTWLSPNVVYDAIDLVPTSSASPAAIASVTVTPANPAVGVGGAKAFTAVARDSSGNALPVNIDWAATRGTLDPNGNYLAPATTGSDTLTAIATRTRTPGYSNTSTSSSAIASSVSGSGSTTVNVVSAQPPTIAIPAAASPNPASATTANLSVLGADDGGEPSLTYAWSLTGTPPAPVTFSANGTNAAKNTVATFTKAATYNFLVTVTDASGLSATSSVTVPVSFGALTDSVDVGSPTTAGGLSFNPASGAYTIKGGGADVWGTADQFRYGYVPFGGNGEVIARVVSSTNTNASAKAGVMFRDSTAASAAYAYVWVSPSNAVKFETRAANGVASAYSVSATPGGSPVWVKLVRSGAAANQFAAFYSLNGVNWTQVGATQTVAMAASALAGLAVTSHNNTAGSLNTAVFDNLAMSATVAGDQAVAGQSDIIRVARSGSWLDVYLNNTSATPTYRYDYASLSALMIQGVGGDDSLTFDAGGGPVIPAGGVSFDAGAGANTLATLGAVTGAVSITSGVVSMPAAASLAAGPAPSLSVSAGAGVTFAGSQRFASLNVIGSAALAGGGNSVLVVGTLTLGAAASLDLADNAMILTNSTEAAVGAALRSAFAAGAWNGPGVRSSAAAADAQHVTALGYATAAALNRSTFAGVDVAPTDLLIKYTYCGDADLSGSVTLDDFTLFLRGYQTAGANAWLAGDFDFSGLVTLDDFTEFLAGYQRQGPKLA
jgi:rhamnogalacturonan endolyase